MARREERRAAAREGILAAAHRQLADGGCASASVVAVAERAGVAAGSLYRHFPSRAALLAEVVGGALRAEHALLQQEAERAGRPAEQRLEAWLRVAAERLLGARGLMGALLLEPAEAEVEAVRVAAARERRAALAALLAEGAAAGAWPVADHAAQAAALDGAVQAALVGPLADERLGSRPDPHAEAAALVALGLGAVRARRGGPRRAGS